jgi:hypothetical protein
MYFDKKLINGKISGGLDSIIFNFSAKKRNEVLNAAKIFAAALGLPKERIAAIGRGPHQILSWEGIRSKQR